MSDDIVERLRMGGPNAWEVYDEAADEIERLRALVAYFEAQWLKLRELMDE